MPSRDAARQAGPDAMDDTGLRNLTAEHLRLTLPLMSLHAADYGPQSYALWFAYASGAHPRLTAALEPVVSAQARLTGEQTRTLVGLVPDLDDLEKIGRLQSALLKTISRTADASARTLEATGRIRASVSEAAGLVADDPAAGAIKLAESAGLLDRSLLELDHRLRESEAEVAQRKARLDDVRREARTDALTRLPNRRAFDEALGAQMSEAQATGRPLSLVIIDADRFKKINDELGHVFGDRVLGTIAEVLSRNVKGKDVLARFGGEEFALLLPETARSGAAQLAEQLRDAVERIRIKRSGSGEVIGNITVSCGITQLANADTAASFIDRADGALYEAKRQGRNRVAAA
ncbi:MAG: diguanylate cyclase [Gammaproteobacteria bacterium]